MTTAMAARGDPLESQQVCETLRATLAPSARLHSAVAALAALVHSMNLALDFRPTGTPPTFESADQTDFSFLYRHPQSAMEFQIKVGKLGGRAIINGIAVEDDKTRTLDVVLTDYFSTAAFAQPVAPADVAATLNSSARLKDLIGAYKRTILQPLIPGLQKEGYTEEEAADARQASRESPSRGRGGFYPDPGGPLPFGGAAPPPVSPLRAGPSHVPFPSVGSGDLQPLGGLGGTTGGRVPIGGLEGDGMLVGPHHPLFRDRFSNDDTDPLRLPGRGGGGGPPQGPWGGDGFLPPMGAPPGARFDPVGPFTGGPRPGPGGFGGPRGGGPPSFGGGGGEPDFDDFPPPRGDTSEYDMMFS